MTAPAVQLHRSRLRMLGCADTGPRPEATVSSVAIATLEPRLGILHRSLHGESLGLRLRWALRTVAAAATACQCQNGTARVGPLSLSLHLSTQLVPAVSTGNSTNEEDSR